MNMTRLLQSHETTAEDEGKGETSPEPKRRSWWRGVFG